MWAGTKRPLIQGWGETCPDLRRQTMPQPLPQVPLHAAMQTPGSAEGGMHPPPSGMPDPDLEALCCGLIAALGPQEGRVPFEAVKGLLLDIAEAVRANATAALRSGGAAIGGPDVQTFDGSVHGAGPHVWQPLVRHLVKALLPPRGSNCAATCVPRGFPGPIVAAWQRFVAEQMVDHFRARSCAMEEARSRVKAAFGAAWAPWVKATSAPSEADALFEALFAPYDAFVLEDKAGDGVVLERGDASPGRVAGGYPMVGGADPIDSLSTTSALPIALPMPPPGERRRCIRRVHAEEGVRACRALLLRWNVLGASPYFEVQESAGQTRVRCRICGPREGRPMSCSAALRHISSVQHLEALADNPAVAAFDAPLLALLERHLSTARPLPALRALQDCGAPAVPWLRELDVASRAPDPLVFERCAACGKDLPRLGQWKAHARGCAAHGPQATSGRLAATAGAQLVPGTGARGKCILRTHARDGVRACRALLLRWNALGVAPYYSVEEATGRTLVHCRVCAYAKCWDIGRDARKVLRKVLQHISSASHLKELAGRPDIAAFDAPLLAVLERQFAVDGAACPLPALRALRGCGAGGPWLRALDAASRTPDPLVFGRCTVCAKELPLLGQWKAHERSYAHAVRVHAQQRAAAVPGAAVPSAQEKRSCIARVYTKEGVRACRALLLKWNVLGTIPYYRLEEEVGCTRLHCGVCSGAESWVIPQEARQALQHLCSLPHLEQFAGYPSVAAFDAPLLALLEQHLSAGTSLACLQVLQECGAEGVPWLRSLEAASRGPDPIVFQRCAVCVKELPQLRQWHAHMRSRAHWERVFATCGRAAVVRGLDALAPAAVPGACGPGAAFYSVRVTPRGVLWRCRPCAHETTAGAFRAHVTSLAHLLTAHGHGCPLHDPALLRALDKCAAADRAPVPFPHLHALLSLVAVPGLADRGPAGDSWPGLDVVARVAEAEWYLQRLASAGALLRVVAVWPGEEPADPGAAASRWRGLARYLLGLPELQACAVGIDVVDGTEAVVVFHTVTDRGRFQASSASRASRPPRAAGCGVGTAPARVRCFEGGSPERPRLGLCGIGAPAALVPPAPAVWHPEFGWCWGAGNLGAGAGVAVSPGAAGVGAGARAGEGKCTDEDAREGARPRAGSGRGEGVGADTGPSPGPGTGPGADTDAGTGTGTGGCTGTGTAADAGTGTDVCTGTGTDAGTGAGTTIALQQPLWFLTPPVLRPPPTSAATDAAGQCLLQIAAALRPSPALTRATRQFWAVLRAAVRAGLRRPRARLFLFGSMAQGLAGGASDLDLCLVVDDGGNESVSPAAVQECLLGVYGAVLGMGLRRQDVKKILHARVPIIKHSGCGPFVCRVGGTASEGGECRGGGGGGQNASEGQSTEGAGAGADPRVGAGGRAAACASPGTGAGTGTGTDAGQGPGTGMGPGAAPSAVGCAGPAPDTTPRPPLDIGPGTKCTDGDAREGARPRAGSGRGEGVGADTGPSPGPGPGADTDAGTGTGTDGDACTNIRAVPGANVGTDAGTCVTAEGISFPFDISMSWPGVVNSTWLQQYVRQNRSVVQPLSWCVTQWARHVGINNNADGYLSTYCLTLLLLFYLVRAGALAPVAPSPADLTPQEFPAVPVCDPAHADAALLGRLATGFFGFYGWEYPAAISVVSLRSAGEVTKAWKGWCRHPLAVEDPLEPHLNLGRNVSMERWLEIRQRLREACKDVHAALASTLRGLPGDRTTPQGGARDRGLVDFVEAFARDPGARTHTFEGVLTRAERRLVHEACQQLGLSSKSQGSGHDRCLTISKGKGPGEAG